MTRDNDISRRNAMKIMGATGATALVAGCSGGGGGGGNESGDHGGSSESGSSGAAKIEPGTKIVLKAETSGWVGQKPSSIKGKKNPTLALTEGESYELGWNKGDGSGHNIEVLDGSGSVVTANGKELSTEVSSEGGPSQFLKFDASSKMAKYQCQPHQNSMHGQLKIESGSGGGSGNESGNTSGNSSEGGSNDSGH